MFGQERGICRQDFLLILKRSENRSSRLFKHYSLFCHRTAFLKATIYGLWKKKVWVFQYVPHHLLKKSNSKLFCIWVTIDLKENTFLTFWILKMNSLTRFKTIKLTTIVFIRKICLICDRGCYWCAFFRSHRKEGRKF